MLLLVVGILCSSGCTSRFLSLRRVRENPLGQQLQLVSFRGPKVSDRTWRTLQRFDMVDIYEQDHQQCFQSIRDRIQGSPDGELIHALAELSYVEGKRAEQQGDSVSALNHFGVALTNSYDYLFSEDLARSRNFYDPQFRGACDIYNQALEDTLRLLTDGNSIKPGETYTIKTPSREFVVKTAIRGGWSEDEFDRYEFVSDYEIETLRNRHTTYGLGVPLIAVRKPQPQLGGATVQQVSHSTPIAPPEAERYYPDGLSYAVTAMMRCLPESPTRRPGDANVCVLEFFDPLTANQIFLNDQWVPLETDLTTPLAFFLDSPDFRKRNRATEGLLNPNDSLKRSGLYMLEPYDPDRIPVLMVHGLWSSPMTWMDMFNDLRSFPEIRERYQFWFYLYPSGQPFWLSATQLRRDLRAMRNAFDPGRRHKPLDEMVLVGHSMGGLVSRMQTIDSGDDFWEIVSDQPARNADEALARLKGESDDRTQLVSALFFKPNSSVKRVITIGTPHHGSHFANGFTRWLARMAIDLPVMAVRTGERLANLNPNLFKDTALLTTANAIDSLAPESPIFPVIERAIVAPDVKLHNIVGVLEKRSWYSRERRGDGVVDFESAHLDPGRTESEIVVDAEHTSIHMQPKAIFEVRRILLSHLQELDAVDRLAERQGKATPL
ncbi:MAG: alpha/beta fold hydrolase [Planctomycetota bacterium]